MKLVVSYDYDDGYTWSAEKHVCLNYESAEALYIFLEEKLKSYQQKLIQFYKEYEKWDKKIKRLKHQDINNKVQELWKNQPIRPNGYNKIHPEFEFEYHDFADVDRLDMPEIQTLEEWWATQCVNPE